MPDDAAVGFGGEGGVELAGVESVVVVMMVVVVERGALVLSSTLSAFAVSLSFPSDLVALVDADTDVLLLLLLLRAALAFAFVFVFVLAFPPVGPMVRNGVVRGSALGVEKGGLVGGRSSKARRVWEARVEADDATNSVDEVLVPTASLVPPLLPTTRTASK